MNKVYIASNILISLVCLIIVLTVEFRQNYLGDYLTNVILSYSSQHHLQDLPSRRLEDTVSVTQKHPHHYHERLYTHNFTDKSVHKKSWMLFEIVDGLQNDDVVMVVTSTSKQTFLRERIISAARTWMRLFANVVVIIEDTFEIRFSMRHCLTIEHDGYTAFSCHNEPVYVMSRKCSNAYYVAGGICCKVDDAINYLVNIRTDLFKDLKYLLLADDDVYFRPDQTLRWLAAIEKSGVSDRYPIIANGQFGDPNNKGVWHIKGCDEIHSSGWYEPMMINHLALQKMAVGVKAYGLKQTCEAFDLSQDSGIGVWAWLYGLYHVEMPGLQINPEHTGIAKAFYPTLMAVHYVKHEPNGRGDNGMQEVDRCDKPELWPIEDRYNQQLVIGCGEINKSSPHHDKDKLADMYDAWNYFKVHGTDVIVGKEGVNEFIKANIVVDVDGKLLYIIEKDTPISNEVQLIDGIKYTLKENEKVMERVIPRLLYLRGYAETEHAKKYDILKEWHKFTMKDCNPPGRLDTH